MDAPFPWLIYTEICITHCTGSSVCRIPCCSEREADAFSFLPYLNMLEILENEQKDDLGIWMLIYVLTMMIITTLV